MGWKGVTVMDQRVCYALNDNAPLTVDNMR